MKLTELDPSWATSEPGRSGMGIVFECPCCKGTPRATYIGVWFANPLDGGPPAKPDVQPAPRWGRFGDTFERLSLSPSIDASSGGHWHGFIAGGDVR